MKEVALFYGTYTGVTGEVAQKIVNELGADKVDPEQTDAVVEQLSRINEQLAQKNRRANASGKPL